VSPTRRRVAAKAPPRRAMSRQRPHWETSAPSENTQSEMPPSRWSRVGAAAEVPRARYSWPQRVAPPVLGPDSSGQEFSSRHNPDGSLFPLPLPVRPGGCGSSRDSLRRCKRRYRVWGDACEAVHALNALYGSSAGVSSVFRASDSQKASLAHILKTVAQRRPVHVANTQEAVRLLLGSSRSDYMGNGLRCSI